MSIDAPGITMIETDWGSFRAPDDLPPLETVMKESPEEAGYYYRALEPAPAYKTEFYSYVKDQGNRLRDGLEPQTYMAWKT